MNRARQIISSREPCEIIDFDEAFLESCPLEERAELMVEARILAHALAEEGTADELESIAASFSAGDMDPEMERGHARKLAAALKRLARDPWGET
jgi:hypothetical protein